MTNQLGEDTTMDYMNGYHFGFSYARAYGNKALFESARRGGLKTKTDEFNKGLVDAALALVERAS